MKKRVLLGASHSVIEPLGLLHLGGLARDLGFERRFHLVENHNFEQFFEVVKDFKPNIVGFNVYTGNHLKLFNALKRLKKDNPEIITVLGGPHATYFPVESKRHADYVVMSEGFGAFKRILKGEVAPGIIPMTNTERFPHPDRETFYNQYPEHRNSRIKSIITMTGCPYSCSYCYNSSTPQDIKEEINSDLVEKIAHIKSMGGRLFPHNIRSVEDVIKESREIAEKWETEVIYCQDDVHGFDIKEWMPELARRWPKEVGLPYHAQMRWEMTKQEKRLDLLREAGCFGLTLAIEAADPVIRTEVLSRRMSNELIFKGMKAIIDRGFRVRTEQITGLPYGATSQPTLMNLEADLQLVELNVNLRRVSGGPTMAWASTLVPYEGTKLGTYCADNGYYLGNNNDISDNFFDRSVLRFPKKWVGRELKKRKAELSLWLDSDQLERYHDQNAELRNIFNFVTLVPEGHKLAKSYLESSEPFTFERLGRETEVFLNSITPFNSEAGVLLENIIKIKTTSSEITSDLEGQKNIRRLAGYFGCLPKWKLAAKKFIAYATKWGYTSKTLSTATRHHLYDNVLYSTTKADPRQ